MKQWECIVCGWVYDESVGDPDSGIAPGTKFEDIPDDWYCPECGVGKDDFELLEVNDATASAPQTVSVASAVQDQGDDTPQSTAVPAAYSDPVVIIGAGMAGYGLLKEFRKLNRNQAVTLICADDGRVYSKPALSTGYTKGTSGDDLTQAHAAAKAIELHANILTHTQVTHIDTERQTVTLNDGAGTLHYAKLVLAQGANCIECRLDGNSQDHVFTINDLGGFEAFQRAALERKAKRIGIIGAGLIGCEYANDLLNGGFKTISVDPMATCLPSLLPEACGQAVQAGLEELGAEFHFGQTVVSVSSNGSELCMHLSNGSDIPVDMVLSAIGVTPNLALAQSAGLDTKLGIKTDRLLQTSAKNVYAVGDCAEVDGRVLVYVAPLVLGTRALAKTLNDEPTQVVYPAMPVAIKTPACPVVVCPPPMDAIGEWEIIKQEGQSVHAEFENPQGEVFGFALTGEFIKQRKELEAELEKWM